MDKLAQYMKDANKINAMKYSNNTAEYDHDDDNSDNGEKEDEDKDDDDDEDDDDEEEQEQEQEQEDDDEDDDDEDDENEDEDDDEEDDIQEENEESNDRADVEEVENNMFDEKCAEHTGDRLVVDSCGPRKQSLRIAYLHSAKQRPFAPLARAGVILAQRKEKFGSSGIIYLLWL
jgi:hypothetical protein